MSNFVLDDKKCGIQIQLETVIKEINHEDVELALKEGQKAIVLFESSPPEDLLDIWEDVKLMISMIRDYISGEYINVEWKVITTISAGIIYFTSKMDGCSGLVPFFNYLNESSILRVSLKIVKKEFSEYKNWLIKS